VFFRRGVDLSPIRHDVPVGQVFLLADNRSTDTALDSRDAGPVPLGELVGRPGPVLWSDGPAGPRFDRLGVRWE
jgi:type IV secretory pathway protease TraF